MADLGMITKVRPVLALSVAYQPEERTVVTFVSWTTTRRGTQYEVARQTRGLADGAFDAQGIGSIPNVEPERRLGVVEEDILLKVEDAVRNWLNL